MKVLEYIINAAGTLIYPASQPEAPTPGIANGTFYNTITLTFYTNIVTAPSGVITPSGPVITGLTGTVIVQARPTVDSAWANIANGTLDLAASGNTVAPLGLVSGVKLIPSAVTGCNYIVVRLDRGS